MALNFPGPYEVRLFYTTSPAGFTGIQHVAKYNIALDADPPVGEDFANINARMRNTGTIALDTWVDSWVALLLQLVSSAGGNTIDLAELWKYTPGTFDASYVASYSIALAGLSGAPPVPAGQAIQTYRTQEGGIMKLSFMETGLVTAVRDAPPFTPVASENIRQAVIADTNCWLARDTSYPIAAIGNFVGQNEALFKRRYRPT